MSLIWLRARLWAINLRTDQRGIAATEFAVIVPLMLVMFFGTVEVSNGVSVDRKVTMAARVMSDLPSQSTKVTSTDLDNFRTAANAILTPYSSAPLVATVTELWIDPATLKARVQWSYGSAARTTSSIVTIPTALAVSGTYVIMSEVSYLYTPAVGYVMAKTGVTLGDTAYTRPRQAACVLYNTSTTCPTS